MFDIDKLYVASYNYDNKGNRIEFIPSREEIRSRREKRLRDVGITDEETIAREVYKASDKSKSIYDLNSREACENLMLERYLMVMSDDKNINSAKVPLDTATDYLKGKILKKDIDQNKPLPKPFTSLKYLTPSYQLSKKAEYASAKKNLGIFALAGSHHVLTQLGEVSFKPAKSLVKFNMLSLNKQIGEDGIRILDWLSAMINAHVDVAKDPYINRLNVVNYTCNMVNLLLRTGKGEATFYFMPQPILKEIANAVDKVSGRYGVDNTVSSAQLIKRAKDEVLQRYIDAAESLAKGNARFRGKLDNVLKKTENGKPKLESINKNVFNIKWLLEQMHSTNHDFDWYYNQLLIAKTFEELEPYAQSLASLVKYSQIDTKKFGNNFNMQRQFMYGLKNLLLEAPFEGVQRMFETTFLDTKVQNSMLLGQKILDGMLLRTNQSFTSAVDRMLLLTSGLDSADEIYLNNVTNALEASVKSEFFDNYVAQNNIGVKELLYGNNTVAKRLRTLKEQINAGKYPDLAGQGATSSNELINYLVPRERSIYDAYNAPDFITTPALRGDDANLKNKLIRYYEELLNHPDDNVRRLFEDVAIYAFYTSGDNSGINTIFDIVPNSYRRKIGYADFIRGKEQTLTPTDFDLERVFRNNWYNDKIVPPVKTKYWVTDKEGGFDYQKPMIGYWTDKEDSVLSRYSITVDGETYDYPLVFKNEIARPIGQNSDGASVFPAYVKVKLGYSNNPAATVMYRYIGNHKKKPIYMVINKLGLKHSGNALYEYGKDVSDLSFNNVVNPNATPEAFYNYFKSRFPGDPMHEVFENFTPIDDIAPLDKTLGITYEQAIGRDIEETITVAPITLNIPRESKVSTTRKTYKGLINSLEPNQIFVFGSNTEGRHGKGAALTAKNKFGAIYGQAEGPQGQSYAIITKDLTKSVHPSVSREQIQKQISNLYEYARQNPDKEFLVAYSGNGSNLNGYSNQEMADMFTSEHIPSNIVFEEGFNNLLNDPDAESINNANTSALEQSNPFEGMRQVRFAVPNSYVQVSRALEMINKLKAEESKGGELDDDIGFHYNMGKWLDDWTETEAVANLFDDKAFASDVDNLIDSYIARNPDMYGTDFSELSKNIKLSEILTNIVLDSGAFVKEDLNQLNLFDNSNFSDQAMKHCKE